MRKISTMAALLLTALALVACGSKEPPAPAPAENTPPAVTEAVVPDVPEAPVEEEPTEAKYETPFWSAVLPDGFTLAEDGVYESEKYGRYSFEYRADADSEKYDGTLKIVVSTEESLGSFRRGISDTQEELRDYANGVGTVEVGGVVCKYSERESWGSMERTYRGRNEPRKTELTITISGSVPDDVYAALLDSFEVLTEDVGNVDAPYPWDGERLTPDAQPQMVGTFTIEAQYLEVDESLVLNDTMDTTIAAAKGKLYAITRKEMVELEFTDTGLKFNEMRMMEESYEYADADNAGNLYLSPGLSEIVIMDGFTQTFQSSLKYDLAIHPSGDWGITFWVGTDTAKVTVGDGIMSAEPWVLTSMNDDAARVGPFNSISTISINDKHILVAGKHFESRDEIVIVYDLNGKELFTLADTKDDRSGLGYTSGVVETANGFMVADGNMRDLVFWNTKGEFIGKADVAKLFGLRYCWMEDVTVTADGDIIVAASEDRSDDSAEELILYRIKGF